MQLDFNKNVVQNILKHMFLKCVSRQELAIKLNIDEFLLLGYLNIDILMTINTIKQISKILEIPETKLFDKYEDFLFSIFNNEKEQENYTKWLREHIEKIRNERIDFSNFTTKKTFNPNL